MMFRCIFTHKAVWFAFIFWAVQTAAFAGIYCCTKPDGKFEFRDTPCQNTVENQAFLPLPYEKTDKSQVKKQEKALKKTHQALVKQQNKQDRLRQKKVKQSQLEKDKAERRQAHCLRIQKKIELIESQLRQGCKLKKSLRLQAQLEQAEQLKQRYCVAK